jgi:hypothetical protein
MYPAAVTAGIPPVLPVVAPAAPAVVAAPAPVVGMLVGARPEGMLMLGMLTLGMLMVPTAESTSERILESAPEGSAVWRLLIALVRSSRAEESWPWMPLGRALASARAEERKSSCGSGRAAARAARGRRATSENFILIDVADVVCLVLL